MYQLALKGSPASRRVEARLDAATTDEQRAKIMVAYSNRLDAMEKKFTITSSGFSMPNRVSMGTLMSDLVTGGGLVAGTMVQISGREKGGKSTQCLTTLGSVTSLNIPIPAVLYWDAENALNDPRYASAVLGRNPNEIFFGKARRARLYQEAVLEDFYNSTKMLMRSFPDKYYIAEHKTWYFVFDADQEGRKRMSDFGFTSYEKTMYQDTGRLWCPTDMTGLQGLVFCDSYPALVPIDVDDSDDNKRGMALDAGAFSKNIKKIKGILKRKAFVVVGVNQIRLNPGARMQNPEYEPGGEALKFYSDLRMQNRGRSVSSVPGTWGLGRKENGEKTSEYGEEPSVDGTGTDRYTYIYTQNTKNKTAIPYIGGWQRIWFRDRKGKPHGYDPVFDTYQYLMSTGRITTGKKGFHIGGVPELKETKFSWADFKLLILAETTGRQDLNSRVIKELGIKHPEKLLLRKRFFKELRTGKSLDMLSPGKLAKGTEDMEA